VTQLTILTPTWNRRPLLSRLVASLTAQDVPPGSFAWLVVDDGSTDGTADYVRDLEECAPFPVKLIVRENGGKHRALNTGVPWLTTPWVLVLDSDDWIVPGGLGNALGEIAAADGQPGISAIVSPRVFGDRPRPRYPAHAGPMDYATWRSTYFKSDFSMLVRTDAMRATPFPEFDGENFIAESAVYARAFATGGIRLSNAEIMGAEYQKAGLSAKMRANRVSCPLGAMHTYRCQLDAGMRGRQRVRSWMNYHRFRCHARQRGVLSRSDPAAGGLVWRPAGWILFALDRMAARSRKS